MTSAETGADTALSMRASRRNALVRRLYGEFPRVPAGFVADAVLQAYGDELLPEGQDPSTSETTEEFVERRARERLVAWQRRADLASMRISRHHAAAQRQARRRHSA